MSIQMTWLLIDDDADDREIFLLALKPIAGTVTCLTAKDGIEALEILKQGSLRPDCIILDLNMPRMDGRKCLHEIKNIERLKNTPVFIYSTSSESRLKEELIQMGATDYIEKPASINLLSVIISALYDRVEKMMER